VAEGLPITMAAEAAIAGPLTDDVEVSRSLKEMINVYLTSHD
jgi:nitric oxide reductase NorQ protein